MAQAIAATVRAVKTNRKFVPRRAAIVLVIIPVELGKISLVPRPHTHTSLSPGNEAKISSLSPFCAEGRVRVKNFWNGVWPRETKIRYSCMAALQKHGV